MKKFIKIIVIILVIFLLMFVGKKVYFNIVGVEPEDVYLTVENKDEKVKAVKCGYKWNDHGIDEISDSINPVEISYANTLDVNKNDKIYFSGSNWDKVNSVLLLQDENGNVVTRLVVNSSIEEKYITVPDITPGKYIVQIKLYAINGEADYAIQLNIAE